jgi:hypothetical protein
MRRRLSPLLLFIQTNLYIYILSTAIAMSAEEQSLLPQSKGAPEIYGSRPPSLNNGTGSNEEAAEWNAYRPRPSSRNWPATLSLGLLFVGLVVLLLSQQPLELPSPRPEPGTIEERVNRILSDTPLIGRHFGSFLTFGLVLTVR